MKKLICLLLLSLITSWASAQVIDELQIKGDLKGQNNSFSVQMEISDIAEGSVIPILKGQVGLHSLQINASWFSFFSSFTSDKSADISLPKWITLIRAQDGYSLQINKTVKKDNPIKITIVFNSKTAQQNNVNSTTFWLPMATIRQLELSCQKDTDLEIENASKITKHEVEASDTNVLINTPKVLYRTNLAGKSDITIHWKPKMKVLRKELSVACDMKTLVKANVGVLQVVNDYNFNVIQGELQKLKFDLPKDVNVTRVNGSNIQDWHIEEKQTKVLCVNLTQAFAGNYNIQVEAEKMLGSLPFETSVPAIQPQNVIRCGGMLLLGTDNRLKISIEKSSVINQIDNSAFIAEKRLTQFMPRQRLYAYQFANMPYILAIGIDNVVPVIDVENYSVIHFKESEITLEMSLQLDVKDAAIISLEAIFKNSSDWIVTAISGYQVSEIDSDCRQEESDQKIDINFIKPILGTTKVIIKAEKVLAQDQAVKIPTLEIKATKNHSGYLIMSADKGIQIKTLKVDNLREIHTGSSPIKVENAQKSYRFKNSDWQVVLRPQKNTAIVYCEAFHLSSLGEGVVYNSVAFTYFISGSPVNELSLKIPTIISNIEITGSNIENWQRTGDVCRIKLNRAIMDDYTFLVTYDEQFDYQGDKLALGRISTLNTANEMGYLVVSSAAALQIANIDKIPLNVMTIGRDELPAEYAAPVTAPILKSYKYTKHQHALEIEVKPLATETLLTQVADYVSLSTHIGERGGVETTATYYLKNTSRQFLVLKPPVGAKPWHAKLQLSDGTLKNIVMQQKDDCWLLPVERPRNPNDILTISVTYAQQLDTLSFWTAAVKGIELSAPQLVGTDAVYAGWQISVNEKSLALKAGNMYDSNADANFLGSYWNYLTTGRSIPKDNVIRLVRSVNTASSPAAQVKICIKPNWLGKNGKFKSMLVWLIIGCLILLTAIILKNKLVMAFAFAVWGMGLIQSNLGLKIALFAGLLILLGAALRVVILIFKILIGSLKKLAHNFKERRATKRNKSLADKKQQDDFMDDLDIIEDQKGFVNFKLLLCFIGLQLFLYAGAVFGSTFSNAEKLQNIVINSIDVTLVADYKIDDTVKNVKATFEYKIKALQAAKTDLLPKEYIVTDYKVDSKKVRLDFEAGYYSFKVDGKGDYTVIVNCVIPVKLINSASGINLFLAPSYINQVKLEIAQKNLDVLAPHAINIASHGTNDITVAKMSFGADEQVYISWQPRKRQVELEKAVIYVDLNTATKIKSGVLENRHQIKILIVQGENHMLEMLIPEKNNVTAVDGADISTWKFDPNSHKLEIVFSKPQSGSATINVTTQFAIEGLPAKLKIKVPIIENIARQRGSIAIDAAQDVQFNVDGTTGVSLVDNKDFEVQQARNIKTLSMAKKFRYNLPENVVLLLTAEKVLPEIISSQKTSISVADDKIEVAARLELQVNKAGVFDVDLLIPLDYEPEVITGALVNHWNDSKVTNNMRLIKVNFNQKLLGKTTVNILLTRVLSSLPKDFMVPKIKVVKTRKQTGRVTIIAEKGLRLTISEPEGIDVRPASSVQVYQAGALVFDILRQNWSAKLNSEVLDPIIRPEVLLWVNLDDGLLQYNSYINYQIENAGIKSFTFQSPKPDAALTFSGSGIANVDLIDKQKGIWQVVLSGKVENKYSLRVTWQEPFSNDASQINIEPLKTLNTQPQRGYLAVTCNGRIQIEAQGDLSGLKIEDARNIPSFFGVKGLADAIFCYRTLQSQYNLKITIMRNQTARVLPATIDNVQINAVLDDDQK